jgi:hypothetical protein
MPVTIKKPKDLASIVSKRLVSTNIINQTIPSESILEELFECLFYTSLHSEEGRLIKVTVTFFDKNNPQLNPRKFQASDKWQFVPFISPIPYNVNSVVKLAKAADPWSTSLAINCGEDGKIWIEGMIDQAIHSQSYINFEADKKPDQPGLFKASINGIGNISVITEYDLIGTLNQDCLITEYINVFQSGAVSERIFKLTRLISREVKKYIKFNYPNEEAHEWDYHMFKLCRNTISRILNQIKNYNHGGAILFTSDTENLKIKYKIDYERLASSITNLVKINLDIEDNDLFGLEDFDEISVEYHKQLTNLISKEKAAINELKGAIRFVASQSGVDGLVLVDFDFIVRGFGVVIQNEECPDFIYSSDTSGIIENKLKIHNTERFGTRHRSMFAYCNNHPGSLGFVISQDGDIRAITKVKEKLIMWENIQTQKTIQSRIFKREKKSK